MFDDTHVESIFSKLREMENPELVQMCLAQWMKSTLMPM
jgi:hypothetical protein